MPFPILCELLSTLGLDLQHNGDDIHPQHASEASSSSMQIPGSWPVSTVPNPSSSGFFAGAINTNANQSFFTDVKGNNNVVNNIIKQDSALGHSFAVLDKLKHAKRAGYQHANHRTCLDGTRIAQLRQIGEWEVDHATPPVYWLRGVPGSGKSTIAQTFAIRVAERSSAAGRLSASFFCSRDFEDKRNIHLIFPTLAYYLATQSPEFRAALIPIINEYPDVCEETLDDQFEKLFVRPFESMATMASTIIVIDALDECEDHQPASRILSVLGRYIKRIPSMKFFITGRPELPIRKGFAHPSLQSHTEVFVLHDVDPVSVNQDIALYLRTCLMDIATNRSHWDLTDPWPTDKEITVTIKKCSGLFIVASVIVKFVSSPHHKPRERLKIIISEPNSTIHEGKSGLDRTYYRVLSYSFEDIGETEFFIDLRLVVGSIVVALDPLSCSSLASILGITEESVRTPLRSLHSIFLVPDSESEPIRVCHKSLADYLTDNTRCTDPRFYIDPSVLHLELGLRCLRIINCSLKRNICQLPRYALNTEIDGRREIYIGGELEYGCRFWASHLRLGSKDGDNVRHAEECLSQFLGHHLLEWLEVLSIVGELQCAVHSLHDVAAWLIDTHSSYAYLSVVIEDSERFLLRFFDAIESSASHIYESALPFSPESSFVRTLYYREQLSPDVKISCIDDSWDACVRTLQLQKIGYSVEFSHNDNLIAFHEGGIVEVFDTATGRRRATLELESGYRIHSSDSLAFSADDTLMAIGYNASVEVWDLQTGSPVGALKGHTGNIRSIAFSPCGNMIATSSNDCTIRLWSTSSFNCQSILKGHLRPVLTICWSGTGGEIISGSDDTTVKVWSISDMKCSTTFTIHTGAVTVVTSLPGSHLAASGSWKETIKVFDIESGDVLHTILTHCEQVQFLDRDQIMYAQNGTFVIRSLTQSADVLKFKYEGQYAAISSDGTRLVSCQDGGLGGIWQTNITKQNKNLAGHHTEAVACLSNSRDGRLVASGSADFTAKIWDTSTRQCITTFRGHSSGVWQISLSPDSRLCGSWGDAIRIWDVRTGSPISSFCHSVTMFKMCFSPDSSQLVSLSGVLQPYTVDLWQVATGNRLASIELKRVPYSPTDISFDDDGSSVILKYSDETIYRWRISFAPPPSHQPSTNPDPSSLPLVFIPIQDNESFIPPELSPAHQYYIEEGSSWVMDKQGRRRLWVQPDLKFKSNSYGTNVVLGSLSGRVTFVDFSDVDKHVRYPRFE